MLFRSFEITRSFSYSIIIKEIIFVINIILTDDLFVDTYVIDAFL